MPRELGSRPRFLVDKADQSWRRVVEYPLLGRVRGRFSTGPLTVRTSDPFGLVQLDRQFVATSEVMVTPRVVPLPTIRATGGAGSTGEARPHRIGVVGQDDVLVREYRQGDDVRRIHWRSTARWGDLMVRREEQAWDPSASIMLDSRAAAHAGRGHAELDGVGDLGRGVDRDPLPRRRVRHRDLRSRRTAAHRGIDGSAQFGVPGAGGQPADRSAAALDDHHALRRGVGHRRPARPTGDRHHGPDERGGCQLAAPGAAESRLRPRHGAGRRHLRRRIRPASVNGRSTSWPCRSSGTTSGGSSRCLAGWA